MDEEKAARTDPEAEPQKQPPAVPPVAPQDPDAYRRCFVAHRI